MKKINEAEAEILFEEHLRERGWDIADFTVTRKRFRDHLDGEEADRVFLHEGKVVAILEAKKPGRDLWAALEQAKAYARAYKRNTGHDVPLLFASDGEKYLRQNLKANTLPESIPQLPTPAEFNELFRTQSDFLLGDLRDYQRVAVSQVLAAVQAGRKQMYIQMATGTGKTITAAGIIAKLWSLGLVQRALFLVDRDALAAQTERAFRDQLGDSLTVRRATGDRDDRFADVLVTTVQHLAVHSKYETFPSDHFGLVFLDECHRSYYGDWHGVLEHFAQSGAIRLGLTATPSDKETQSTDRYFCDRGQYQGPVYRYSIRQGEQDEILAQCHHFKFHTNVDLHGVHDMGFDFEPNQLGRAGDVPQRNAMIAEKYFEVIGRRDPIKTIVFAAGIRHAVNLRYALIRQYNELHHARLEEGEEIVTNETPGVIEEPIEQEEETIIDRERGEGKGGDEPPTGGEEPEQPEPQEMIILDVPVTLESSEVLAPALLEDLRRQIESQLRKVISRDGLRERFVQTVYSWCYFKGSTPMDHSFLATLALTFTRYATFMANPKPTSRISSPLPSAKPISTCCAAASLSAERSIRT